MLISNYTEPAPKSAPERIIKANYFLLHFFSLQMEKTKLSSRPDLIHEGIALTRDYPKFR